MARRLMLAGLAHGGCPYWKLYLPRDEGHELHGVASRLELSLQEWRSFVYSMLPRAFIERSLN